MDVLRITNLSKVYPNGVKAVDDLALEIGPGMFGLLGPNGAGKSTLMRTVATLQSPDVGTITFGEIDVLQEPMRLRQVLGYLPQEFGVYPKVTAERLLDYLATLKGISQRKARQQRVAALLQITNLYDVRHKHVSGYSGGMKQRFGIAQLMLNNPKLIIVDEPTAGLDPVERNRFLNILREISTQHTVIFSTHIVEDVRELCHTMAIMHQGRILQHCTPNEATQQLNGQIWQRTIDRAQLEQVEDQYQVLSAGYNPDHSISVRVYGEDQPSADFAHADPSLEDAYFLALRA